MRLLVIGFLVAFFGAPSVADVTFIINGSPDGDEIIFHREGEFIVSEYRMGKPFMANAISDRMLVEYFLLVDCKGNQYSAYTLEHHEGLGPTTLLTGLTKLREKSVPLSFEHVAKLAEEIEAEPVYGEVIFLPNAHLVRVCTHFYDEHEFTDWKAI